MERVLSATEARVRFGELMRQVTEDRQTVIHALMLAEAHGLPATYDSCYAVDR